jgi:outer membrane biosynthesis protein TonB
MVHKKKKNSSKVNLTISTIVHAALIGALVIFAAKKGLLGKKLKQLTVTMVPKEKKPEPPKEKPPEPKAESPKPAESPKATPQAPKVEQAATPPPPANDTPMAAPPAAIVSGFDFQDGAKAVQTMTDPNGIYKSMVEHSLKSHWDRDESIDDSKLAAEVEVTVDSKGRLTDTKWLSLSGNARWDASVKNAVAQTKTLTKAPPKGFPPQFIVRFDVESMKSEAIQLSSSN